jgi:hypothetical protein
MMMALFCLNGKDEDTFCLDGDYDTFLFDDDNDNNDNNDDNDDIFRFRLG